MRAAVINDSSIVINYAEVSGFTGNYLDPLDSAFGDFWNGTDFIKPSPPPSPRYPPDTPEQAILEYKAMINRRADALEAAGDHLDALLLRESLK